MHIVTATLLAAFLVTLGAGCGGTPTTQNTGAARPKTESPGKAKSSRIVDDMPPPK